MIGFFNVNKESGISSAKVVSTLKHKFQIKDKIGHMGTLDPLAQGVLVVGVGRANRLFDYMKEKHKVYEAEFEFGYQTISLDTERDEIAFDGGKIPTSFEINEVLPKLIGKQNQVAPMFSAKNINGRRAYEIARNGENVNIKPHEIEIYNIKLLRQSSNSKFLFSIDCSGGTYIRSIARDLATLLKTYATMTSLKRVRSGKFDINSALPLEKITLDDLVKVDVALSDMQCLNLTEQQVSTIRNGIALNVEVDDGQYCCKLDDCVVGICVVEKHKATMKTWLL